MPGSRPAQRSGQYAVWIALGVTIAGIIFQGGYLANQVANNGQRIAALEARMDRVNAIDTRLARMEGKMDAALTHGGGQ